MIPPTPWVRSFCPLSLLYPSVSDFQFRYTPVTVGKGRAAWFSLRSASVLSFGRGDKAAESGDVDYEYLHIIKGLYATCLSWHIDPCRFLFILSIVLNKISTFLFNTNDFQPFSPAIRWEYNQKRSLYICNKAQPSHEDCASNSFLFCLIFKRVLTYIYL